MEYDNVHHNMVIAHCQQMNRHMLTMVEWDWRTLTPNLLGFQISRS
jgi:hypothetical protein